MSEWQKIKENFRFRSNIKEPLMWFVTNFTKLERKVAA